MPGVIKLDQRPGKGTEWWWAGDGGQVGWFVYNFESLWMPASLLGDAQRGRLSDAIFAATRSYGFSLHFNKGLAGAPADAIARATNTAMNPQVTTAFALAICADGDQGLFPGIYGHQPNMQHARAKSRGSSHLPSTNCAPSRPMAALTFRRVAFLKKTTVRHTGEPIIRGYKL